MSVREPGARPILARAVIAAFWLGAAALFAVNVAPSAFAALPSRELAGAVVGRVLPVVFWSGAVTGAILLVLELTGGRASRRRIGIVGAALMLVACLVAQLAIAPRIAGVRASLREPLASLAADHPQRRAFGRLHMLSVAWLGVAMLGGAAVVAAAVFPLDRKDDQ